MSLIFNKKLDRIELRGRVLYAARLLTQSTKNRANVRGGTVNIGGLRKSAKTET
jgi:hypothetical protein